MSDLPLLDSEVQWYNVFDCILLGSQDLCTVFRVSRLTVETCELSRLYGFYCVCT